MDHPCRTTRGDWKDDLRDQTASRNPGGIRYRDRLWPGEYRSAVSSSLFLQLKNRLFALKYLLGRPSVAALISFVLNIAQDYRAATEGRPNSHVDGGPS